MMTHEPCHGRVAREEQQHDRRVASLDLEESACGQPAFVAFCQSGSPFCKFCIVLPKTREKAPFSAKPT